MASADVGVIVGGTAITVQIQEVINGHPGRKNLFTFVGAGLSFDPVPAGASGKTAWVNFRTRQPATLEDFDGMGAITVWPNFSFWRGIGFGTHLSFFGTGAKVYLSNIGGSGFGVTFLAVYLGHWEMLWSDV